MRFGKISAAFLVVAAIILVFEPRDDNLFGAELALMVCVAFSFVCSIVGLFKDSQKLLSIVTACISGVFIFGPLFAKA